MLYKEGLDFESVDEILKCDHSSEIYWAVLSYGAFCFSLLHDRKMKVGYILNFYFGIFWA